MANVGAVDQMTLDHSPEVQANNMYRIFDKRTPLHNVAVVPQYS